MSARPRPLVAGNWKMNGLKMSLTELGAMTEHYDAGLRARVDLLVCPPFPLLQAAWDLVRGAHVAIGAQDCHPKASGAHTGDVSAEMIADCGATHVIVGHSERRADHGESNALVHDKAAAAHRAGLVAIVCVGETRAQRETGGTLDVVSEQMVGSIPRTSSAGDLIVAYEPVWAIGTGLTPTAADVAIVHAHIRRELALLVGAEAAGVRILYGGSVKPSNAAELMGINNVDGALVGGASLTAADFLGIAAAYR